MKKTDTGGPSDNQDGIADENGGETGGETVIPDVEVKVTPTGRVGGERIKCAAFVYQGSIQFHGSPG